jgi:cytochrome c oxidase assembly factor 3
MYVSLSCVSEPRPQLTTDRQEMSPGLKRARAPFRVRNAITGSIIASFAVGVWAYSLSAVKQDNFDDVDEEAKALAGSGMRSIEDEEKTRRARNAAAAAASNTKGDLASVVGFTPKSSSARSSTTSVVLSPLPVTRGILAPLLERNFPRLLDPMRKTLVWGAPPVDKIGRMQG